MAKLLGRKWPEGYPSMSRVSDTHYLQSGQYYTGTNLDARIALHARFSVNPQGWQRWVFDQFSLPAEARLLELGCGPAALWQDNLERILPGWELTLSDFSTGMVSRARNNIASQIPAACFQTINAQAIPFPRDSFDAVIANHMLYHVPDRDRALMEIRRVLKPGGRLYATTVGEKHLSELSVLVQRFDSRIATDGWYLEPIDFTLENGLTQLSAWFKSVHLKCYEDALIVTQAKPLAEYILSTVRLELGEEHRHDLLTYIQTQLDANLGALRIANDSGLFIASI